jgi:hypothetical protein
MIALLDPTPQADPTPLASVVDPTPLAARAAPPPEGEGEKELRISKASRDFGEATPKFTPSPPGGGGWGVGSAWRVGFRGKVVAR